MQYYLLPHNIFNFGQYPRPQYLQDNDYILVVGDVNGLRFNEHDSTIQWNGHQQKVERVDKHEAGTLYRYQESPPWAPWLERS